MSGVLRRRNLPEDHFAQIHNDWLRDERLSFRARGVLALLCTHRDGFGISLQALSRGKDKVDAVRKAVQELEEVGYLVRPKPRQPPRKADGTFEKQEWILQEPPPVDNAVDSPPPVLDSPTPVTPMH